MKITFISNLRNLTSLTRSKIRRRYRISDRRGHRHENSDDQSNLLLQVLREPKKSNQVDEVLKEYSKSAKKGALLFSVVGGKLSEGLNFNDDLGRCVLVIGLPYPNMMNPELKEKMNYLNTNVVRPLPCTTLFTFFR